MPGSSCAWKGSACMRLGESETTHNKTRRSTCMHCSSNMREQFQDLIVDVYVDQICPTETHSAIAGRLWRCTDILPGGDCETMDIPRGPTYAQTAHQLKQNKPSLRRTWEQCKHNQPAF